MSIVIVLFVIWFICTLPFLMLGLPSEASGLLGLVTGILVVVCMSKSNDKNAPQTTQQPLQHNPRQSMQSGSASRVPHSFELCDADKEIDELTELDMTDGELDGHFGIFDND